MKYIINSGGVSYDCYWGEKYKMFVYGFVQYMDCNSYYGVQKDMNVYGKINDLIWVVGGMYVGNMDCCFFVLVMFIGGVEYQSNLLYDVMMGYYCDMQQDVCIVGGFVQNEWWLNCWMMFVGVCLDKYNLIDYLIFSLCVNFLYKLNDNLQVCLIYFIGFWVL